MPQYAPEVTDGDVERIVRRDYPPDTHAAIHDLIRRVEVREKARVILACLKNGKGDFEKLKGELSNAEGWWKDIISEAEYPNYTKKMFRIDRIPAEEQELIFERDKAQYLRWILEGSDRGNRNEA